MLFEEMSCLDMSQNQIGISSCCSSHFSSQNHSFGIDTLKLEKPYTPHHVHIHILSNIFRPLSSRSLYYRTLPSFLSYSFFLLLLISFSTRFCPGYISLSLRGNKTQGREEEGQREELEREKDSLSSEDGRQDPLITAIIVQSGLLC